MDEPVVPVLPVLVDDEADCLSVEAACANEDQEPPNWFCWILAIGLAALDG